MPKQAKFQKGLLSNKTRLEEAYTVTMNERCSAVLLNKLPSKEKDPESLTIPYDIGHLHIDNALADLGMYLNKKITLRVGNEEVIFDVDQSIKRPPTEDDECYGIDFLDPTIHSKTQELLEDDQLDSFLVSNLEESVDLSDLESCNKTDECRTLLKAT
ncbi:hypothetical protein Tco_0704202 [Tanacetum coccineum]|uniref:Reverse transcriptase domain-containing protein n=1 Tax=Tanacetum coccineum TaxID=301880 RepID=A0ABQ4Y1Y6_9ASTR